MEPKDVNLIKFVSNIIIDSHLGNLKTVINDMEEEELENIQSRI